MIMHNRTIGDLIPEGQRLVTARESDSVEEVARRMREGDGISDYSQVPLKNDVGTVTYAATWKAIAQGFIDGQVNTEIVEFADMAPKFDLSEPTNAVIDTIKSHGYVFVTQEEDVIGIVSYSDVL